MVGNTREYRKLDFSKLKFAETPISMDEALKDVTPLYVPEEVIRGEEQMIIDLKGIHYVQNW